MFPLSKEQLEAEIRGLNILEITSATIRQIASLAAVLEDAAGEPIVHLEIGNPGLPASQIGIEAEREALSKGIASVYPNISGIPMLKEAGSRFLKAFLDIDHPASCIVPSVGSMQGSFMTILLLSQRDKAKDTISFLLPGFPAQRLQARIVGLGDDSFDILEFRGKKLEEKLRSIFEKGNITALLYSNPNNPAWTNLTEEELEIIGRLANEYDVVVIEDLAYMGMDFRRDMSHPGEAPFVPTVAKYTDNYVLLSSASKIFSYAGERIAMVCISPKLWDRSFEALEEFYGIPKFGNAFVFGVMYACSSGTSHAAQYALASMLDAAADGRLNFVDDCREYKRRGERARKIFERHGFHIVYSHDGDEHISDGFFFTVGYGDMTSAELQAELLRYGIASISLPTTGSAQNGLRICVSMLNDDTLFNHLDSRLSQFADDHKK